MTVPTKLFSETSPIFTLPFFHKDFVSFSNLLKDTIVNLFAQIHLTWRIAGFSYMKDNGENLSQLPVSYFCLYNVSP